MLFWRSNLNFYRPGVWLGKDLFFVLSPHFRHVAVCFGCNFEQRSSGNKNRQEFFNGAKANTLCDEIHQFAQTAVLTANIFGLWVGDM